MIVSCPSCTTRYELGDQADHEALSVTCRRCQHQWTQYPVVDIQELPRSRALRVIEHEPEPNLDVARLVEAAKSARIAFTEQRKRRSKQAGGWAAFAVCALIPFIFAGVAPETTVLAAPIAIKAYQKLGWAVNVYGLDIRRVEQQNKDVDGQRTLLVKGEVSNPTNDIHKIPSLRFSLSDADGKELYTWILDTTSRPLRAGETTTFSTRIAAPPELAKNLQIRFAHNAEIGSNPPL